VIFLRSHLDSVRLPCFYISQNSCTLPAFSLFTGGFEIVKGHQNQIFAIVDSDHILRI
jgi:metallophosphoesterase superfamily enzyme